MGFDSKMILRSECDGEAKRVTITLHHEHQMPEASMLALLKDNPNLSQLIESVLEKYSAHEKLRACKRGVRVCSI